eukprot:5630378-Pyramimonas_sp.AAC.1
MLSELTFTRMRRQKRKPSCLNPNGYGDGGGWRWQEVVEMAFVPRRMWVPSLSRLALLMRPHPCPRDPPLCLIAAR